ncbi:MAG: DUF362 domain-containing protein [Candidatus Thorarchaeota archaeon]
MNNDRFLVSKVVAEADLKKTVKQAVDLIGGLDKVISPADKVTIKPNLNTADPYPASSDPAFIKALGEVILEAGASRLEIMDSSTIRVPTRGVAEKIGLNVVADELDADLILLDEHEWVKVKFPRGKHMKSGSIGKPVLDIQKLVLAPNIKTHFLAWYTGSMKLFVGWLKHSQRIKMHSRKLQEKVVDLASFFNPDLIVMDARTCFVEGGPATGTCSNPGVILASGDMVSVDVEGVRIIQCCNAKNKLNRDVWEIPQIRHAVEIGIGARSDSDIELLE